MVSSSHQACSVTRHLEMPFTCSGLSVSILAQHQILRLAHEPHRQGQNLRMRGVRGLLCRSGQREPNAALALAMLLRLKEFAVRAYGLQPDRVRAFATATAEKKRLVCQHAARLVHGGWRFCSETCCGRLRPGQVAVRPMSQDLAADLPHSMLRLSTTELPMTYHRSCRIPSEARLQRADRRTRRTSAAAPRVAVQPDAAAVGRRWWSAAGEAPSQGVTNAASLLD